MLEESARNVLLTVVGAVAVSMAGPIVSKSRTKQRQRMHWAKRRDGLDERGFKKRYRLSKAAFAALVVKISPLLERQCLHDLDAGHRALPSARYPSQCKW